LTIPGVDDKGWKASHNQHMPEEQLSALLAKLSEDADLRAKLQSAEDLDAAEALVQQAGFDVSKADWLKYLDAQSEELTDKEIEAVAGGKWRNGWVFEKPTQRKDIAGRCTTESDGKGGVRLKPENRR